MLGSLGAAVQVVIILYLMVSSVVGFYSSPLFTGLLPRAQDTTLTQVQIYQITQKSAAETAETAGFLMFRCYIT